MDALACYASDSESEPELPDTLCQGHSNKGKCRSADEDANCISGQNRSHKVVKRARPNPKDVASQAVTSAAPPVPDAILTLFPSAPICAEPHQGRTRGFPHVVGNFPTHVFVRAAAPVKCQSVLEALLVRLAQVMPGLQPTKPTTSNPSSKKVSGSSGGNWVNGEYHMSLSRTVAIRIHQQAPLLRDLRVNLRRKVGTFSVALECLAVFVNDDRSRTFLAVETVCPGAKKLVQLITRVDLAFTTNNLKCFYANPRPHVSVAWVLGDQEKEMTARVAELFPNNGAKGKGLAGEGYQWNFQVADVECKVGNKIHSLAAS
eukprot:5651914-Pyramimonas_sp.AAC.1